MDKGKKILAILIIVSLLTVSVIGVLLLQGEHDHPIDIKGDDELREAAERYDWDGAGTAEDPFVITMDLDVDGAEMCISLFNTSLHVTIRDCVLTHHLEGFAQDDSQGIGILLDRATNVVLTGNYVSGGVVGLMMVSCTGITALNNTFGGMYSNIMLRTNESRFDGNLFTAIEGKGLDMQNNHGNNFSRNSFDGNVLGAGGTRGYAGLVLSDSSNNSFYYDHMSGAGYMSIGIAVLNSSDNRIDHAELSGRTGAYMFMSNDNELSDNLFADVVTAIEMLDSDGNIIVGNDMLSNYSATGVKLTSSDGNQFERNDLVILSSSGYAVDVTGSKDNQFINNSFRYGGSEVRALALAFDDTAMNQWNDTAGGNHWSVWTAPDADLDGIVDQPYLLDGGAGAADHRPLLHPWTDGA